MLPRLGLAVAAILLICWTFYAAAILRTIKPEHVLDSATARQATTRVLASGKIGERYAAPMPPPDPWSWRPPAGEVWTEFDRELRVTFVELARATSYGKRGRDLAFPLLVVAPLLLACGLLLKAAFGVIPRRLPGI
ncbi:MAG: hypothetical protein HC909_02215 [Blastochloris sp.]|nr:hypothetical protein [Blastochloris sp.]